MAQPRAEHPRPQFHRSTWMNLNGTWEYALDPGLSGDQRGWSDQFPADGAITIPFCPESALSGVGHTDFIPSIWYRRSFFVPAEWSDKRILLHFGAVDYDCRAWVNNRLVGRHYGGSSSFTFDITQALSGGENVLTVCAVDDIRSGMQASGKQSSQYHSQGCHYTRTTGIWQTVWLEAVPAQRLAAVSMCADLDGGRFIITPTLVGATRGQRVRVTVGDGEREMAVGESPAASGSPICVSLAHPHPWSPADPHLYDLRLELLDGDRLLDQVSSYAGLRKFHIEGNRFFLNNRPIFLRFVLDQGFYPQGIWTAPTDADLKEDIRRAMAVGFNGARLHQKVFEERFHYWADRLGYLTWGEYCDWGMRFDNAQSVRQQQQEWREILVRDRNHPSIIAWTPFNETAGQVRGQAEQHRRVVQETVDLTRELDPSRPLNDTSGYVHVCTDIFTVHDYDQDPASFAQRYAAVDPTRPEAAYVCSPEISVPYTGQPYMVDEYGGTWWADKHDEAGTDRDSGWGYGNRPGSMEEVYSRIERLTAALLNHPHIAGFTYTQLTDIEQEQNGIYTYDRQPKFDSARLRHAFAAEAASESR